MFAVFEQPDLKASFTFTVQVPAEWQVISNAPAPSPEPGSGGSATWRFPATQRMSSYITALVAGPYHRIEDQYRSGDRVVPLSLYCRASLAEHLDADVIFEETRQGFEFFERVFDFPYPFEKYDQLFVPEFNAGAMENAGCVTHNEDYVFRSRVPEVAYERRAVTILHEMAHMWFGDLVTMTWWNDLWLNESFAEYASTLAAAEATKWKSAWTTFANTRQDLGLPPGPAPVDAPDRRGDHDLEDVEVNFDGITYAKGASVLKLLAAVGGPGPVHGGHPALLPHVRVGQHHTERPARKAGGDVRARPQGVVGRVARDRRGQHAASDLHRDDEGRFTRFTVTQEAPDAWPTLRSHRLAIALYDRRRRQAGPPQPGRARRDGVANRRTGPGG
jgi:aminopeptidase N